MSKKTTKPRRWIWPVISIGAGLILGMIVSFSVGWVLSARENGEHYSIARENGYSGRPGAEKLLPVQLSFDAASVVSRVNGSVVTVISYDRSFWYGDGSTGYALGSGVLFREDETYYYLLTNEHVVDGAIAATLYFRGSAQPAAEIMGGNADADVAVLRVAKADIAADILPTLCLAEIGDSEHLGRGDFVVAIGTPSSLSYMNTVTVGVISGLNRTIRVEGHERLYLQIDAALNPGNSGGALFDAEGRLIGINAAKVKSVYGVNLALPINEFMNIAEALIGEFAQ